MKTHWSAFAALWLSGCLPGSPAESDDALRTRERALRSRVAPLTALATRPDSSAKLDPALASPFDPDKLWRLPRQGPAPDLQRAREPLEHYPLEQLRLVGVLQEAQQRHALVRTPDGTVFPIRLGSRLGQQFGRVDAIDDERVTLIETVADPDGNWGQRRAMLSNAPEAETR